MTSQMRQILAASRRPFLEEVLSPTFGHLCTPLRSGPVPDGVRCLSNNRLPTRGHLLLVRSNGRTTRVGHGEALKYCELDLRSPGRRIVEH
jgi:hypothetical protein